MKKISLALSVLFSVCLLSCTDYKADIQDAHDSFVRGNLYDDTSCVCYMADESSFIMENGVDYYRATRGRTFFDYGVKCTSSQVSDIKVVDIDYTFASSADVTVDGELLFGVHYALNRDAEEMRVSGMFSPTVEVIGATGFVETLQCPRVYFDEVPEESGSNGYKEESSSDGYEEVSSSSKVHPAMDLWDGASHEYRVITGLDENGSSGYWFAYTDNGNGMESILDWPVPRGNSFSVDAFDPVIDACGGLCGTVYLSKGASTANNDPFVGVGFNVAGSSGTQPIITDASSWGGLCITYTSSVSILVMMSFGDAGNEEVCYDRPIVTLDPTSVETEVCYRWSEFEQRGNGWTCHVIVSGDEGSTRLGGLNFEIYGPDGTSGAFNIIGLGRYR